MMNNNVKFALTVNNRLKVLGQLNASVKKRPPKNRFTRHWYIGNLFLYAYIVYQAHVRYLKYIFHSTLHFFT